MNSVQDKMSDDRDNDHSHDRKASLVRPLVTLIFTTVDDSQRIVAMFTDM